MTAVAWSPDTRSTLAGDGAQPTTGDGNQPTAAPPTIAPCENYFIIILLLLIIK